MWTITVTKDPDTTGVGTISGTWTDESGTFTVPGERFTLDDKGQAAFLTKADVALKEWQSKQVEEDALSSAITTKANAK
jgi:hypothetical protein